MSAEGPTAGFIRAPWDREQVDALNRFQRLGHVHEFTCPEHHDGADRTLYATRDGWRCPHCGYEQDWAHESMLYTKSLEGLFKLPCDVLLPPATLICKGAGLDVLMAGFKARGDLAPELCRFNDPKVMQAVPPPRVDVVVTAMDYHYPGQLAGLVWKASGIIRYVIEDAQGRLFIHNHGQIDKPEGWTPSK